VVSTQSTTRYKKYVFFFFFFFDKGHSKDEVYTEWSAVGISFRGNFDRP
jgi:hypothetical protein